MTLWIVYNTMVLESSHNYGIGYLLDGDVGSYLSPDGIQKTSQGLESGF